MRYLLGLGVWCVCLVQTALAVSGANDVRGLADGSVRGDCSVAVPTFACLAGRSGATNDLLGSTSGTPGFTITGSANNAAGAGLLLRGNSNSVGTITLQSNAAAVTSDLRTPIDVADFVRLGTESSATLGSSKNAIEVLPNGLTVGNTGKMSILNIGTAFTLSHATANLAQVFLDNATVTNGAGVLNTGAAAIPFASLRTHTADGTSGGGLTWSDPIVGIAPGLFPSIGGLVIRQVFQTTNNGHFVGETAVGLQPSIKLDAGTRVADLYGLGWSSIGTPNVGGADTTYEYGGTVVDQGAVVRTWSMAAGQGGAIRNPFQFIGPGQKLMLPTVGAAPTVSATGSGSVTSGTHTYKYTCVNGAGESAPSAASASVNPNGSQRVDVTLPACTAPSGGTVTRRRVYRTVAGNTGNYKLIGSLEGNTGSDILQDTLPDAALDVDANTAGATVPAGEGAFGIESRESPPTGAPTTRFFWKDDTQRIWRLGSATQTLRCITMGNGAGPLYLDPVGTNTACGGTTEATLDKEAPGPITIFAMSCGVTGAMVGADTRRFRVTKNNGTISSVIDCTMDATADATSTTQSCWVHSNVGEAIAGGTPWTIRMDGTNTPAAGDVTCAVWYTHDGL